MKNQVIKVIDKEHEEKVVSMQEIADLLGVNVEKLKIKK